MLRRQWITDWNPNDGARWQGGARAIARRNLVFSIFAEFLGFSVWQLWSVVAVQLNRAGFHLTVGELFWLVSVPGLVGATLRVPYGFAVPLFGGRNWTVVSAALLLVPTALLASLVQHPGTSFPVMLAAAATAGFGGGNFASSMSNISFFYPDSRKGWALGLNAAGGNIGVAVVQFVVPAAIGLGVLGLGAKSAKHLALQNAGLIWIPFVVAAAVCAFLFMDNLAVSRAGIRDQAVALRRKHTWVMSWLYIGTFGSFIGYAAALPLLMKTAFPSVNALEFAFLGPLVGSAARPLGGWLSDRLGGAVVTFWTFAVMALAALGVIATLSGRGDFPLFLVVFLVLFVCSGVGNGSTFRMIPAIFNAESGRRAAGKGADERARIDRVGRREAASVLGFSSAIAAYGSFFIPQGYSLSLARTGSYTAALVAFVAFYATCLAVTWWFYLRVRQAAPAAQVAATEPI
ncbi:MAG TPA: MFS transporter [Candidatus Dormibacteraeota bacterium]|nr:MFS transporter [Candidatus Dormibacteraeota bacterium]